MHRFKYIAVIAAMVAVWTTSSLASRADAGTDEVDGRIVSIRAGILQLRPQLRPKMTRAVVDDNTIVAQWRRVTLAELKPGVAISVWGRLSDSGEFQPRGIDFADKPLGYLADKTKGVELDDDRRSGQIVGVLKSVTPFVITDSEGKDFTYDTSGVRNVSVAMILGRSGLLIGLDASCTGQKAPDGVLHAELIMLDQSNLKMGTMFGEVVHVVGDQIEVRPRYASDTITARLLPDATLNREVAVNPDSIKVGDRVTLWCQRARPWGPPTPDLLRAIALLPGDQQYPQARDSGDEPALFHHGTLTSLDPVKLKAEDGKEYNVMIPGQMLVARIELATRADLKPGARVMLILTPQSDGTFTTNTVVFNASPYVGYR